MIDLHSHILPGIDDGSKNLEMTKQLLEALACQNVRTVVATPHFYASKDTPEAFLQRRQKALEQVATLQEDYPQILPGAEVAYFDGMERSGILEQLQLGNSGLLLVEMPFCSWTQRMIRTICDLPLHTGLTPVLAHVNRYRSRDQLPRYQDTLIESGVLFQYNAEVFTSLLSRHWALKQLDKGYLHFLGSDTHNLTTRSPMLHQAAQAITRKRGADALEQITAFTAKQLKL